MAKPNDRVLCFMVLSLLLFITLVVNGKNGDTCFDISKTSGLGSEVFNFINPNLNCTALFVGQWLRVDGTLS
ncbi:unnamed protein product [Withania somnifera]